MQVWHRDITNRLRWYDDRFFDDEQRFEYIYCNTKGDAAKLASSYRLDPPDDWTPQDFINFLTQTFDNPTKRENASTDFETLLMSPNESFWEFWRRFRTTASDAKYHDDRFLREQMRSKVLVRLSNVVQLEWDRCHNLNDYVSVLRKADAHFHATQQRQKRRSLLTPESSSSQKNFSPNTRSTRFRKSNNTHNSPENSGNPLRYPKHFNDSPAYNASSFISHQRKTHIPENRPSIRQQSKPPGRIYEITEDKIQQEIEEFEEMEYPEGKIDIKHDLIGKDDA